MTVIQELAKLIDFKNSAHKVDLKMPKVAIIVEVIKGLCCISILPDYFKLKKYNIHELCNDEEPKEETPANEGAETKPIAPKEDPANEEAPNADNKVKEEEGPTGGKDDVSIAAVIDEA